MQVLLVAVFVIAALPTPSSDLATDRLNRNLLLIPYPDANFGLIFDQ